MTLFTRIAALWGRTPKPAKRNKVRNPKTKRQERRNPITLRTALSKASEGVSLSTAANYRTAVCSFTRFMGGKDIPLQAIDEPTTHAYERWLAHNGVCLNTSSCYLRSLRALYNKETAAHRIKNRHPFDRTFTGNMRTTKRSLTRDEFTRLQQPELPEDSREELTRRLFLFSFCAMGMPFVDMAHLRRRQIKNGMLTYCRRKTGQSVSVRIEPYLQEIIDRYTDEPGDYVFPILSAADSAAAYHAALNRYNRRLKILAERVGIHTPLTSYTARHTWASLAYAASIDLPVISKALGHNNTQTTLIYISEINDERVANANKKLLENLITPPLYKRCNTSRYRPQR